MLVFLPGHGEVQKGESTNRPSGRPLSSFPIGRRVREGQPSASPPHGLWQQPRILCFWEVPAHVLSQSTGNCERHNKYEPCVTERLLPFLTPSRLSCTLSSLLCSRNILLKARTSRLLHNHRHHWGGTKNFFPFSYVYLFMGAPGGQRHKILLELELKMITSCLKWVLGANSGPLQNQQELLTNEPSFHPPNPHPET